MKFVLTFIKMFFFFFEINEIMFYYFYVNPEKLLNCNQDSSTIFKSGLCRGVVNPEILYFLLYKYVLNSYYMTQ